MSSKRHTVFIAIVLSVTMVCAVLVTAFDSSDGFSKTYICYEENNRHSGIAKNQGNASLIPKPIKEANFEEAISVAGWLKSEKITALQNNSAFYIPVKFANISAAFRYENRRYTKLLCRLLI